MIIAVVGKTSSGKDSIAKYIYEKYNIPMVVSYTTRPKRDYETDGKEHWFISKDKMKEIMENEKVIAYTINEKTGIEYCATEELNIDKVYVINPEGIYWFHENNSSTELKSIYVDIDEDTLKERGKNRGDNMEVLETRLNSEREEFNSFRDNKEYDYLIKNDGSLEELYAQVDSIMKEILK